MPIVNFREIEHRFGHLDGEVVDAHVAVGPDGSITFASITIRYFPWFEHLDPPDPKPGQSWRVVVPHTPDQEREVKVVAVAPRYAEIHGGAGAMNAYFSTDDSILWRLEDWGEIILNSDVDRRELYEGVQSSFECDEARFAVARWLSPYESHRAPYSLGVFPFSLFQVVMSELEKLNARVYVPRHPERRESLVAFFADEHALVASDFVVHWPDDDAIAVAA